MLQGLHYLLPDWSAPYSFVLHSCQELISAATVPMELEEVVESQPKNIQAFSLSSSQTGLSHCLDKSSCPYVGSLLLNPELHLLGRRPDRESGEASHKGGMC